MYQRQFFYKYVLIYIGLSLFINSAFSNIKALQQYDRTESDSSKAYTKIFHRLEVEGQGGFTLRNVPFMSGENFANKKINNSLSGHLKYSFQFNPESYISQVYRGSYQGVGIGHYTFGNKTELGNPTAMYLFQGAQIAGISNRVALNYEWNFGLSTGWQPYNASTNHLNHLIGSKLNAYLNAKFYINWILSRKVDFLAGVGVTHFSNGNTEYPNAGMNMLEAKLGIVYNFNREAIASKEINTKLIPAFERHMSYDLVIFSSWRRKGVNYLEQAIASPDSYLVLGANFNPMYNLGYKFRAGASLDFVYDGSANVYAKDYIIGTGQEFVKPATSKQLALGLSARAEYVMPYFILGLGHGYNILYGRGDLKGSYQIVNLKTAVSRNAFINIGYSLKDFKEPNFLMLGLGYRFNNKYPSIFK